MSVDDVIATETTTEVVRRFGGDLDLWQLLRYRYRSQMSTPGVQALCGIQQRR